MLPGLLEESARRYPLNVAVEDPSRGETITYGALHELSTELRDELRRHGVQAPDRVGICARKSIASLVSMFGVLKSGAAYVPVAVDAPSSRIAAILADASPKALFVERRVLGRLGPGLLGPDATVLDCPALAPYGEELAFICARGKADPTPARHGVARDLAYILYTSGSTGEPKGVMHSHRSASSFIDWCSATFEPTSDDRFSSHAPFHFDLSIADIYVALKHGATVVLIGEDVGKQPAHLAALIAERRISVWYSTPSVLRLLVDYGRMERHDYSRLRLVLFAGEVFPDRHLKALMKRWPHRRYYNLYGPTETNVCTFSRVPCDGPDVPSGPASIGRACAGVRTRVVLEHGGPAQPGEEGELHVSGGAVMLGYWNRPDLDAQAFRTDDEGVRWYRTGDLVKEVEDEGYLFLGRRDRMVKRRGFRIELDEVESLLYRHSLVTEAAVIAFVDREDNVRIKVFLRWAEGTLPSAVQLKRFCAETMSAHLVPDEFSFVSAIPKTSTGKTDYRCLQASLTRS